MSEEFWPTFSVTFHPGLLQGNIVDACRQAVGVGLQAEGSWVRETYAGYWSPDFMDTTKLASVLDNINSKFDLDFEHVYILPYGYTDSLRGFDTLIAIDRSRRVLLILVGADSSTGTGTATVVLTGDKADEVAQAFNNYVGTEQVSFKGRGKIFHVQAYTDTNTNSNSIGFAFYYFLPHERCFLAGNLESPLHGAVTRVRI